MLQAANEYLHRIGLSIHHGQPLNIHERELRRAAPSAVSEGAVVGESEGGRETAKCTAEGEVEGHGNERHAGTTVDGVKSEDVTRAAASVAAKGDVDKASPAVKLKTKLRLIFSGAGEVSMEERRAMLAKYRSPGKKKKKKKQQRTVARA